MPLDRIVPVALAIALGGCSLGSIGLPPAGTTPPPTETAGGLPPPGTPVTPPPGTPPAPAL